MKISYLFTGLNLPGGIQEFAKSVRSGLSKKFDIKLLDWKYELPFVAKVILRVLPSKIGMYLYSNYFSQHFRKKYDLSDADLIHFWEIETATPFLDKNYIVTCHGMEILKRNVGGFRKAIYPLVLKNAQLVCADSDYTKNLIIKNFGTSPNKIRIIFPPIDFDKFSKVKTKKSDKLIIGTLSRFVERKNVINIIKALNILKEKYGRDFIYYLAGDGPEKEKILKALKKAKFEWKYFERISEEDKINKFYPSLSVFVMPPLDLPNSVEGFGIVYLEANAYGIPVVASKTGGIPDAVKEGVSGVFSYPTNSEDIAEKIFNLIKDKDKYQKSAKDWAKKFDIKIIAKQFEDLYTEVYKKVITESKKKT